MRGYRSAGVETPPTPYLDIGPLGLALAALGPWQGKKHRIIRRNPWYLFHRFSYPCPLPTAHCPQPTTTNTPWEPPRLLGHGPVILVGACAPPASPCQNPKANHYHWLLTPSSASALVQPSILRWRAS